MLWLKILSCTILQNLAAPIDWNVNHKYWMLKLKPKKGKKNPAIYWQKFLSFPLNIFIHQMKRFARSNSNLSSSKRFESNCCDLKQLDYQEDQGYQYCICKEVIIIYHILNTYFQLWDICLVNESPLKVKKKFFIQC